MTIKVSQEAREAAADLYEANGVLSREFIQDIRGGHRDGLKDVQAFAQFQAQIEAATVERCAMVADEKAAYVAALIKRDGKVTDARIGVQMAYEAIAAAIRKGPAS